MFDALRADRARGADRRARSCARFRSGCGSSRRRRRLPHARPQRRDAVGRRRAAHPAGDADRREPHRRALRARRAVDRPAPARQPQAAGDAGAPARSRQHGDRRRARRGDDPHRRLRRSTSGPGAGEHGGQVIFQGTPDAADASDGASRRSLTGAYLRGERSIPTPTSAAPGAQGRDRHPRRAREQPEEHRRHDPARRADRGHRRQRLGQVDARQRHPLPLARARRSTGPATSRARTIGSRASSCIDKVIEIDQSPIGRTPRSNPATYTGLFTFIRELFAMMPEAKARGFRPGRFSFNVKGGRCEACQGDGVIAIEMHFLPDVYVTCEQCKGRRYNRETLEIQYRGKSIADVLELTVDQALPLLENFPPIANKLRTLQDVGLGYIELGQSATTLSRRRGAAGQAGEGAVAARHRPHALHPRRADDRPALRGHAQAARRAEQARRPGQHRRRHRAQPRRDQGRPTTSSISDPKAARAAAGSSPRARRKKWRSTRQSATGRVPGRHLVRRSTAGRSSLRAV